MTPYQPIDCHFHDRLLAYATLRQTVEIVYRADAATERTVDARITDVYTRRGEEYAVLSTGAIIRLDRLVRVGGYALPPTPGCQI